MRYACKKKILYCLSVVVIIIILLHSDISRTAEYIEKDNILSNLHEETASNFTSSAVLDCDYYDIVHDDTCMSLSLFDGDLVEGHRIKEGGEYAPVDCKPKFSTAVIVPYRDKPEELRGFLVYMHTFFHRQQIHYRIYVVEQVDSKPFNRAKLMNIGAQIAIKAGYPCLVLHDVDLLPLKPANLYACSAQPRQMLSSIDKFRFVLPYQGIINGALAILSNQYKVVNGMSNEFYGTSGEEDDLISRIEAHNLKLCRFEPEHGKYHLVPQREIKIEQSKKLLETTKERMETDGLNSLKYTEVATVLHPLFTHIMVDL